MNDLEYVALVDTDRDELRQRISLARQRFDQLARRADPLAQCPRSTWNVRQVVAHVLTVAHRYRDIIRTGQFRAAETPAGVAVLNQSEMQAALAPVTALLDSLLALEDEMDGFFDTTTDRGRWMRSHAGAMLDGISVQTNWLGELLLHGHDIARAIKVPWELPERDMLLVARGVLQFAPAFVRAGLPSDTDVSVAFNIPQARPYLIHIRQDSAEVRERRGTDRPDAVVTAPASTFTQMLYQRIGPATAVRHGLRIVGGRRPWRALKLQSCLEPA